MNFSGSKLCIMSLATIYAGEMLKHAKPFVLTFSSKKYSVLEIILVISIYGLFPKIISKCMCPNTFPCSFIALFLCYHSGMRT